MFPAESTARAAIVCVPSGTLVESQSIPSGAPASLPTVTPPTRTPPRSPATLSAAVAANDAVPLTVAPSAGAVRLTVGGVSSIWIRWELTASALPALSNARNLTVLVAVTENGPLYTDPLDAVGSDPSVVYRISRTPDPPTLSVAANATDTAAL